MADWPSALPQALLAAGLSRRRQDAAVRFQPDLGVPITRRRGTAAPYEISGSLVLTAAQLATLDTFFEDTLKEGTLSFTWKDPVTGSGATLMFAGPYSADMQLPGVWRVSLQLLQLP